MIKFSGNIGHLSGIESPWSNAGGVVKTIEDVLMVARTGVGYIEDGSHVLGDGRAGNAWNPETMRHDKVVYHHDPLTGETTNSPGMPGMGMDALEPEIPERVRIAHAYGKKYVLNVAPISDDPVPETVELVRRGYAAGADAVLVNVGCPNLLTVDGGRHKPLSYSPDVFSAVLNGIKVSRSPQPVFVRIPPQDQQQDMFAMCNIMKNSGVVSTLFVPNTWPDFVATDISGEPILQVPGGAGGRSGPAMAIPARKQTYLAKDFLQRSKIDVVSCSGIMNAQELLLRMHIGAVAGSGTTFYFESQNGWQEDTDRLLKSLAAY